MGKAFTPELHLSGEYLKFFRKLRRRLTMFTGTQDYFNEIENDIGEILYTGQRDGKSLKTIIGDDENEYILELLRTFYEANPTKKIMAVKVGMSITMATSFALIGFIVFNNIISSILTGIAGLVLYISIVKKINEGLDSKAIKYMNAMNSSIYIIIAPLYIISVYRGYSGVSKIAPLVLLGIYLIGYSITKWGNLKTEKQ